LSRVRNLLGVQIWICVSRFFDGRRYNVIHTVRCAIAVISTEWLTHFSCYLDNQWLYLITFARQRSYVDDKGSPRSILNFRGRRARFASARSRLRIESSRVTCGCNFRLPTYIFFRRVSVIHNENRIIFAKTSASVSDSKRNTNRKFVQKHNIVLYTYCTAAVFIIRALNRIGRALWVSYKTSMVVRARRP